VGLGGFQNITSEEIDFSTTNGKKRWFIAYSREIRALNIKEFPSEVWSTNYTSYVKFQIYFKIKPRRR
jgi:hypothetical protein